MEDYMQANKDLWNELTPIHEMAELYDVKGFKSGKLSLKPAELAEVGDVKGKSLLHLQCHFGLDTLSWVKLGAKATGVDYSDKAIHLARSLSRECGIEANFLCANIYDLPKTLKCEFDVVFTSYGVLCWLPDLSRWAKIIAHFLKPGGLFYIVEGHPFMNIFDNSNNSTDYKVMYSYFRKPEPTRWEPEGDYTDRTAKVNHPSYEWTHSMSDVINALIGAGLKIEFVHEFPTSAYQWSPFTEKMGNGELWHVAGDKIPLTFSIKATKPDKAQN
jgi:SAM-dependent methyltransferase